VGMNELFKKKKKRFEFTQGRFGKAIISSRKEDENGCRKGNGERIPNANLIMVIIKCGFCGQGLDYSLLLFYCCSGRKEK